MSFILIFYVTLLILFFLGYFIWFALVYIFSGKSYNMKKKEIFPYVSIVIFSHNEESVIAKKIENQLTINYPRQKMEIIFSDSSTDNTRAIIQSYSNSLKRNGIDFTLLKHDKNITLNEKENITVPFCRGDIVFTSDAEVQWDADAVKNAVKYFSDERIGGVTGQQSLMGENVRSMEIEREYTSFNYKWRKAESILDSTMWVHGDLFGFRKILYERMDPIRGANDCNLAINIRRQGYKVIHAPDALFFEKAPVGEEHARQKIRRAAYLQESILLASDMFFRSKYGKFGAIILPLNLFVLLVAPLLQLILLVGTAVIALYYSTLLIQYFFAYSYALLSLLVLAVYLCFRTRTKIKVYLFMQASLLRGLTNFIFGWHHEWGRGKQKIESTRREEK